MAYDLNPELKQLQRAIKETRVLEAQLHKTCKELEAVCYAARVRLQNSRIKMARKRRARVERRIP